MIPSEKCGECNSYLNTTVIDNVNTLKRISTEFIPIKIQPGHEDFFLLSWLPETLEDGFGVFYVDAENNLVHSSNLPANFAGELEIVKSKYKKILSLQAMEEKYFASDKKKLRDLEKLIQTRSDLGQDNYLLLNSYAQSLPKDSLNSIRVLRFLLRQAPTIESKADSILKQSARTERAWAGLSFEDKNKYTQHVFGKSVDLAIKFGDEEYAERLAFYSAAQQNNDPARLDAFEQVFLTYFFSTGDTDRFMLVAVSFFNRMVQRLPPVLFTKDWEKAVENSRVQVNSAGGLVFMDTLRAPSVYAQKLVRISAFFYHFDRQDQFLGHALQWAKTAAELDPNHNTLYNYSLLLNKAGKEEEATVYEKKADEELKKQRLEMDEIMKLMKVERKD